MAKIRTKHVFRLEDFRNDVEAYRKRHKLTRKDLAEAIDISPQTINAIWQKDVLSLPIAIVLSILCDLNLNKYIIDFMEHDVINYTPVGRSQTSKEKMRAANRAKVKAMRRLAQAYPIAFRDMYNQEREKEGLAPI